MRLLLDSLLTASAVFGGAPMMALSPPDEAEIELQSEAKGWLNATCIYYDLGWMRRARQISTTTANDSHQG